MSKIMIVVAVVVVLVAGGVVLWAVLHQGPPTAPPPVATADNEPSSAPAAAALSHRPAVAALPIRPPVSALPPASSVSVSAKQADLTAQITDLSLMLAQEAALLAAARSSDHARRVKEARYNLPTDRFLRSAGLKLSDVQQRQLQAIKDALKPQQDAALGDTWTRIDDLNQQKAALYRGATPEVQQNPDFQAQANLIDDQLAFANDQASKITSQLDQGYQTQVLAILTPEQQNSFHQAVGVMMNNFSPAPKK